MLTLPATPTMAQPRLQPSLHAWTKAPRCCHTELCPCLPCRFTLPVSGYSLRGARCYIQELARLASARQGCRHAAFNIRRSMPGPSWQRCLQQERRGSGTGGRRQAAATRCWARGKEEQPTLPWGALLQAIWCLPGASSLNVAAAASLASRGIWLTRWLVGCISCSGLQRRLRLLLPRRRPGSMAPAPALASLLPMRSLVAASRPHCAAAAHGSSSLCFTAGCTCRCCRCPHAGQRCLCAGNPCTCCCAKLHHLFQQPMHCCCCLLHPVWLLLLGWRSGCSTPAAEAASAFPSACASATPAAGSDAAAPACMRTCLATANCVLPCSSCLTRLRRAWQRACQASAPQLRS